MAGSERTYDSYITVSELMVTAEPEWVQDLFNECEMTINVHVRIVGKAEWRQEQRIVAGREETIKGRRGQAASSSGAVRVSAADGLPGQQLTFPQRRSPRYLMHDMCCDRPVTVRHLTEACPQTKSLSQMPHHTLAVRRGGGINHQDSSRAAEPAIGIFVNLHSSSDRADPR